LADRERSGSRASEPLYDEQGPLTAEQISAYVVGAAVWAPSVHNTQPWWFGAEGSGIALQADGDRQLNVTDPSGREMGGRQRPPDSSCSYSAG
jgi:hypothetical protein